MSAETLHVVSIPNQLRPGFLDNSCVNLLCPQCSSGDINAAATHLLLLLLLLPCIKMSTFQHQLCQFLK